MGDFYSLQLWSGYILLRQQGGFMLRLKELKKVLRLQRVIGSNDGACFGTSDPSRLRPSSPEPRQKQQPESCPHPKAPTWFTIVVLGREDTYTSASFCPSCLEAHLNRFSTPCGLCGEPITPGQRVEGTSKGYAHSFCGKSAGGYLGVWTEKGLDTSALDRY